MSQGRRLVGVVLGLVAVVCSVVGLTAPAASAPPSVRSITIVGIAGLRWDDVDAARTPTLARLAQRGSVGALSVRSAPAVTCPDEGWLTLGSGTYAAVTDPALIRPSRGCAVRGGGPVHSVTPGARIPTFGALVRLNAALRFGAVPGALGDQLGCVAAAGPGAALAASDSRGNVREYQPAGSLNDSCGVHLIDLGGLPEGSERSAALSTVDERLSTVEGQRAQDSVLMVIGVSETSPEVPRLHVAIVDGPGFSGGWLGSPSTRRVPYVQLVDVAPTVLSLRGITPPNQMAGRAWTGNAAGRPASWPGVLGELRDADRAAVEQRRVVAPFFLTYAVVLALVLAGSVTAFRRRSEVRRQWSRVAAVCAAVPGATFAANLVPWWRAGGGLPGEVGVLWALVAAVSLVVGCSAYAVGRRHGPRALMGTVGGGTLVVLVLDLVTGSHLQIDSLLGYNPLVAGRFYGIGNIAFAALGAASVAVGAAWAVGLHRRAAVLAVGAVGAAVTAVDGFPGLGADFGGVITFVPTFAVLALLAARIRVTLVRLGASAAAGIVVVGGLGVLDYLRPADRRTHFGRFVASVLDGSAGSVVHRKILANLDLLLAGPHTVAAFVAAVGLVVLVFRPPVRLASAYRRAPVLRVTLVSIVVLSVVGFLTNDSGVAIAVVAALVAAPLALAVCLHLSTTQRVGRSEDDDTPRSGSDEPRQLLA